MKRAMTSWIIGSVGLASVLVAVTSQARERKPKAPPAATQVEDVAVVPAAPAVAGASPSEVTAFTFTDQSQMEAFAKQWQQRQDALTRMAVLQAYWNQEQTALQQMNSVLLTTYNLDVNKNYTLDTERRVLLEQGGAPPASPPPVPLGEQQPPA